MIKTRDYVRKNMPNAICLSFDKGKIEIHPSLNNVFTDIGDTDNMVIDSLNKILVEAMNKLKMYYNTDNISFPNKREVVFGEDGTIKGFIVDYIFKE